MMNQVQRRLPIVGLLVKQAALRPKATLTTLRVWWAGLSMLGLRSLLELQETVARIDAMGVPGALIEAGVARGGSAIVLAAARCTSRHVYLYDTFEGIPAPSQKDGAAAQQRYEVIRSGRAEGRRGQLYYGYDKDLQRSVANALQRFGFPPEESQIHLVKGFYQDTLYPPETVALAHLDCDWYESVKTCLERITPALAPGGVLVVDDYDYWAGCRRAVDEFFEDKQDQFLFVRRGRLHIVRRR